MRSAHKTGLWILAIPLIIENLHSLYVFGRFYEFSMFTSSLMIPLLCVAFIFITNAIVQNYFSGGRNAEGLSRILLFAYALYWIAVAFQILMNSGYLSSVTHQMITSLLVAYFFVVAFNAVQLEYGLNEQDSIITIIGAIMVTIIVKGVLGFIL